MLIEKLRDFWKRLLYLPRALRLIWRSAPGWALLWLTLLFVQGLLPALTIHLTRVLVDQLAALLGGSLGESAPAVAAAAFQPILLPAGALAAMMLLGQLIQGAMTWIHTVLSESVGIYVSDLIHMKASQVDYSFYQSSSKYDKLHRARVEANYRPVAVLDDLGMLAQNLVTLASIAFLLIPYGVWLTLVLLVTSLPALWVVVFLQLCQHAFAKRIAAQERRFWYFDWLLTTPESAAEIRLFGLGPLFTKAHRKIRQHITQERLKIERSSFAGHLLVSVFGMLAAGLCLLYMVTRALQGQATLGDLALFYQSFSQGQNVLRGFLRSAGQLYGSLLFLSNLFEFLDLENEMQDPEVPEKLEIHQPSPDICFENVTFRYPGSEHLVLRNFNLSLPSGKITVVVGDNGAGKSTLLKLLCRLYDPEEGGITWNGVDLRKAAQADLRSQITALFQTPVNYQVTAAENIGYSDLSRSELEEIVQAAEASGADGFIRKLPGGYQTILGKLFEGGVNLSGGQWQRIALARAFMRQAPLLLLDEPTSAMDAWSETEWLRRFRELSKGRTTLLITHRLTTAVQADIIHVMVDGEIVESGSHEQLIALRGRYARAWQEQMESHQAAAEPEG